MSDDQGQGTPDDDSVEKFVQWVELTLSIIESVDGQSRTWCSKWWDHPEAVERFTAMHASYVEAAKEGLLSSWWTDHWDRHAVALFSRNGIFEACAKGEHVADRRRLLPTEAPPAGWTP